MLMPAKGIAFTSNQDGAALLDIRNDRLTTIDPTAAVIWTSLVAGKTVNTIIQDLARDSGIPISIIENDVNTFLNDLRARQLVVDSEEHSSVVVPQATTVNSQPTNTLNAPAPTLQTFAWNRSNVWLMLQSYYFIIRTQADLQLGGLPRIYDIVTRSKTAPSPDHGVDPEVVCAAIDLACVFYLKRVLCLQRSAAATLLLRSHGIPAELIIGTQLIPAKSHAWVEIDGVVINDKPYMREIYQELKRC